MELYRRSRMKSSRGHVRMEQGPEWPRWILLAAAGVVILLAIGVVISRFVLPALEDEPAPTDNRTWLEFAWTASPVNDDAIQQLGSRLREHDISMVYLEASAWRSDGSLVEGQYAADVVSALRAAYPELKILLWLRMTGDQIVESDLQSLVVELASRAVQEWDFDGVQLNGLGIANGNEPYIRLVRSLRDAVGDSAWLSVTVPPDRIPNDPDVPVGTASVPELTWDESYKQRVGLLLVDEVVVMAHASGLEDAAAYENWVAYQIESYVTALADLNQVQTIIIALPTYEAAPEHDPTVEEVRAAISGVKQGLKNVDNAADWIKGVGLFEYKTTDSREWALFREYWMGISAD